MDGSIALRALRPCHAGGRLLAAGQIIDLDCEQAISALTGGGHMVLVNPSDAERLRKFTFDQVATLTRSGDRPAVNRWFAWK